jgi:single-strand DNA-binding protein
MAASDNLAIVTGTLGKDPELKYTGSGTAVTTFSLATNRKWKKNDEWQEETVWHNIVVWGELGEHVAQSLLKGNRATVTGRISNRSYDDREGNKKYISEIIADSVGAELRFATAEVERIERAKAGQGEYQNAAPAEDPF